MLKQYLFICSPMLIALLLSGRSSIAANVDWPVYLGDTHSSQYSALEQINPGNVDELEVAWVFRSGDIGDSKGTQIQCNPLIIDGILYGTSPQLNLFALDAATGAELWRFDPFDGQGNPSRMGKNRGLAYWENDGSGRILFGVQSRLYAIEIKTGQPIAEFGENGSVDLKADLGREASDLALATNTPGVIFEDLIIMGMRVAEGPGPSAPGPIRAYNVITGELVWRFDTIPQPGQPGYDTWPEDAYRTVGGANAWTGFSLDEEKGIVFCPTGSAAFDFWGGNRLGDNLFANCLIALDARTGERIWHYQVVRHDLWDRDLPAPPNLLTIKKNGESIPAVAQITKSGHVFVFDRETGQPIYPIEEIPVPESDLIGEKVAPSQPLPVIPEPFARQVFSADMISRRSPQEYRTLLNQFTHLKPHAPWVPPSKEGTIIFPGFDGGGEWGGAAVDPNGIMYVNSSEMPWILTMVEISGSDSSARQAYLKNCASCHGEDLGGSQAYGVEVPALKTVTQTLSDPEIASVIQNGKGIMPPFAYLSDAEKKDIIQYLKQEISEEPAEKQSRGGESSIPYAHTGYRKWYDSEGYPAVEPPWGTLNAINLHTGQYVWKRTLGDFPEVDYPGVDQTGAENYGGPIVTASGLLFIGATSDEMFRAFNAHTGELLWETALPAGGYATPATYMVNNRQFVVIACGGGKMGTAPGDYYVAFALPE